MFPSLPLETFVRGTPRPGAPRKTPSRCFVSKPCLLSVTESFCQAPLGVDSSTSSCCEWSLWGNRPPAWTGSRRPSPWKHVEWWLVSLLCVKPGDGECLFGSDRRLLLLRGWERVLSLSRLDPVLLEGRLSLHITSSSSSRLPPSGPVPSLLVLTSQYSWKMEGIIEILCFFYCFKGLSFCKDKDNSNELRNIHLSSVSVSIITNK